MSRIADQVLADALATSGGVLIEGAKWCGKTWTAKEQAQSVLYLQDADNTASYLKTASVKPSLLLEGEKPRLLDEWQVAPVLWNAVRHAVDVQGSTGLFILTGSAVPTDDPTLHSGTGRIVRRKMRPMSLFESGESNGAISLIALFDGGCEIAARSELDIEGLAFATARGGWPASIGQPEQTALSYAQDYLDAVVNTDVSRVDGVEKNPRRVTALLRSYARNTSTPAAITTLRDDVAANDTGLSVKSIAGYLAALERIHVVDELEAWSPALRSKTAIRSSRTRHLVDPSIAVAALHSSPRGLLADFETFGLLFESLCVRDLRVYASAYNGDVFHYRDKSGLEADAVVCLRDGRWGAVEVKMGASSIDEGAANLLKLAAKIDAQKMNAPSFLAVLTATEYGYRRDDGVTVVPVGCLRP